MPELSEITQLNPLLAADILVLILFTWSGYRRGFLRLAVSLVSMFAGFFLVMYMSPVVNDFLVKETDLKETIAVKISEAFEEANSVRDNTIEENRLETIESYRVPRVVKKLLVSNDNSEVYKSLMVTVFEDYVAGFLSGIILKVLSFIAVYLALMLFIKLTLLSADFIGKLPVIKGLNRTAGGIFGFMEGMFVIFLVFGAASFLIGKPFYEMVSSSRILMALYDKNLILGIISSFS